MGFHKTVELGREGSLGQVERAFSDHHDLPFGITL